ncbi:hypothetical protein [Pseudomonas sp. P9_31]|uniref:hypothetical protein n=1 Tax=Pseudomonas sp. P9_31 TaxID=3043448 RepID=UPI002A36F369|nr:hypothetical protein [Pseudomonas sp. P9_31]WPN59747.1 hypothetical protein QMK51_09135 [Pseudomonas sp. P9_31]
MALSAFGDEIDDEPAAVASPPVPTAQATSAFGDPLSSFGDPLEADPPALVGGMAGALTAAQPQGQTDLPNRTAGQWVTDIGGNVGRGAYNLFDAGAGLGDILSGGAVTPWLAKHGLDSKAARQVLESEMSPQGKHQRDEVANAKGFGPTVAAMLQNPAYTAGQVIESVPTMVVGGVAGRGAALGARAFGAAPGMAGAIGAGTGEGLFAAGQQAAQTVQQTGDLTAGQTGFALLSGGLTGLLGAAGARIGRKLGVNDIDSLLAGQQGVDVAKGFVNRALVGTGIESLEELTQSGQQQVLTNLATDRPAMEGVSNAAGQGAILGGVMGGAASLRRPNMNAPQPAPVPMPTQQQQGMPQAQPTAVPQGLHAQVMTAMNQQQAPAQPVPKTPFAGSVDIGATLDNLGLQGERRTQALDLLRPVEPDVEARRRGVVSNAEQTQLANLIGLDGANALIHGRKLGQTFNAEEFRAVNSAVQAQMTNVLDLQQRIAKGQATDLEKAQFVTDLAGMRHASGELLGAKAEAGRAMAALRRTTLDHKQALAILESVGGVSGADDLAKAIGAAIQSGGLANAAKVIRKGNHITDYIKAGWLYDPTTHVANMAGNTGMVGLNTVDRMNAAVLAGGKRLFGLKGETMWSEPLALLSGAIRGQMKAIGATGRAFATGESPMLGAGKLEQSSLPQRTMPGKLGTAKLVGDNVALLPFRALGAEDAYFATVAYEAQVRALAHRAALAEKKSGSLPQGMTVSKRIDQLANDPTPQMIEDAGDYARESTFNQAAGPIAAKVLAVKAAVPWTNVIVPFVRTPMNVISRVLKGSPAGVLYPSVWRDIRAGGAKQEMALAKMMSGTQAMIGAGLLAQAGYLTGAGPSDNKERDAWLAAGNQPFSVKVGDTWHGYNRLDPFAAWAGLASDMTHMDWKGQDAEKVALKLVASFAENIVSKTWMQGVEGLSQALSDPDRYAGSFLSRTAASVLQPNALLSGMASRQDEYARKPDSFLDAMKARVPGLRESVPVRQDSWGEPMANNRYADNAFNAIAPMTHSKESTDPVRLEAARIGWAPGDAPKHMTLRGEEFPLSAEQQAEFSELSGALIHKAAKHLIRSKAWRLMDDDQRRDALDKVSDKSRAAVRLALGPLLLKNNRRPLDNLRKRLRK